MIIRCLIKRYIIITDVILIFEYSPLLVIRERIRLNWNQLLMIHRHITPRINFIFYTHASLLYYCWQRYRRRSSNKPEIRGRPSTKITSFFETSENNVYIYSIYILCIEFSISEIGPEIQCAGCVPVIYACCTDCALFRRQVFYQ